MTPVTSSNLCSQTPLFTELHLLQGTDITNHSDIGQRSKWQWLQVRQWTFIFKNVFILCLQHDNNARRVVCSNLGQVCPQNFQMHQIILILIFWKELQKNMWILESFFCVKFVKSYSHFCIKIWTILVTCHPIWMHWILIGISVPIFSLLQFSTCLKLFTSDSPTKPNFLVFSKIQGTLAQTNIYFWVVTGIITGQWTRPLM